jgi:hypothetical protein
VTRYELVGYIRDKGGFSLCYPLHIASTCSYTCCRLQDLFLVTRDDLVGYLQHHHGLSSTLNTCIFLLHLLLAGLVACHAW